MTVQRRLLRLIILMLTAVLAACTSAEPVEVTRSSQTAETIPVTIVPVETATLAPTPPPPPETAVPPQPTSNPTNIPAPEPTPSPPPISQPLRTDQILLFARDDALWRSDVHGVNVSQLTDLGFLGWIRNEPFFVDQRPRLSPDSRYVAQLFSPETTRILDLGTGQEVTIPGAWEAAWSPDGRTLAFALLHGGNRQSLWLADAVTGETTELVPTDKLAFGGRIHNIAWSPDGRQIAFDCCFGDPDLEGMMPGSIKVVTVATGEVVTVGETTGSIAGNPPVFCWEDGLVTTDVAWWMGHCSINRLSDWTYISKDNLHAQGEANFSDDGVWESTRIFVTNLVNDELVWEQTLPQAIRTFGWSLDGRYLFIDDQSADSPIWRISADGQETVTLLPNGTLLGVVPQWEALLPRPPSISPDGRWRVVNEATDFVAAVEDELEQFPNGKYMVEMVVERTDGSQSWTAVSEWRPWGLGLTYPEPVQWSADGRFFYFANVPVPDGCSTFVNGGDLWRLDLETGLVMEVAPYIGLVMALSPDETQLAVNASFGRGFLIRDLESGVEQAVELPQPADSWQMGGLQWSPDGRTLLLIQVVNPCGPDAETAVVRVDLEDLSATTILEPDERGFTLGSWVANNEVRLLDKDGHIWYLQVFSGEIIQNR